MAGAPGPVVTAPRRVPRCRCAVGLFLVPDRPAVTLAAAGRGRPHTPRGVPPMTDNRTRRQFVQEGAVAAVALASGLASASIVQAGNPTNQDTSKILNYNPDMEYRRLGKTGLMVSAVALGGHWKRIDTMVGGAASRGLAVAGHRGLRLPPQPGRGGEPVHRPRHQLRRRLLSRGGPRLLRRCSRAGATRSTSASPGTRRRAASPSGGRARS